MKACWDDGGDDGVEDDVREKTPQRIGPPELLYANPNWTSHT